MGAGPTPGSEQGLVAAGVYAAGRRVAAIAVDEAATWLDRPGHVVWIGLLEPGDEMLRRVQAQFGLHDLAIEDARAAHQRPKLEQYGDALFVVARTAFAARLRTSCERVTSAPLADPTGMNPNSFAPP